MKSVTSAIIKLAKKSGKAEKIYKSIVNEKIREKYSINDELAILRQRDTKAEEYAEYNAYVEAAKAEAKALIETPETIKVDRVLTRADIEAAEGEEVTEENSEASE